MVSNSTNQIVFAKSLNFQIIYIIDKSTVFIMDGRRGSGLTKPLKLSLQLRDLIGTELEQMSMREVSSALYEYIKENKLQHPKHRQYFLPDAKMKPIFGNQLVRTFGMNKYLKGHLGDKERSAVTGKAKVLVLKNRVSVGHEENVSDYEKMRLANIKERQEQYARLFPAAGRKEEPKE